MKQTFRLFSLLTAVALTLVACNPDPVEPTNVERDITYTVDGNRTTVHLNTEAEFDALLDRFCDYAEGGSSVTFSNVNGVAKGTNEAVTFSTTDRDAMKRWMARMEENGRTVTVTHDPETGTWNGIAYTNDTPTIETRRKLSRVVLETPGGNEFNMVYTYTWSGNLLTGVDMLDVRSAGGSTDTIHNSAVLTYDGGLRNALYIYDNDGNLVKEFQYVYDNGRLYQEFQSDYSGIVHNMNNWYNYDEFLVRDWSFPGGYFNFATNGIGDLNFYYDSIGNFKGIIPSIFPDADDRAQHLDIKYEWVNGDLTREYSIWDVTIYSFEYDNSPQPYCVSLGTTSLLPGYNTYMPYLTQWSVHNPTHIVMQGSDWWVSYTYNSDGSIATVDMPWCLEHTSLQYATSGTLRWTFEYLD